MRIAIGLLLLASTACFNTYDMAYGKAAEGGVRIDPSASIYVGLPEDASFESQRYPQSGRMAADDLVNALSESVRHAERATKVASTESALAWAQRERCDYFIMPTILHWEDHRTEWTMVPDQVEVELELFDCTSGARLDSTTVYGTSRIATFAGDYTRELLAVPFRRYTRQIVAAD